MSEPDSPTRGDLHHQHHQHHHHRQQQLHQSSSSTTSSSSSLSQHQHNADDREDANSSIIVKVKSRVSSIFPQKLTQWFYPSEANTSNGGVGRRRRRSEDADRGNNSDNEDESNNSAEDEDDTSPASTQQPPTKRSRLNVEVTRTNFKSSQRILSSTPTAGARRPISHMNLYGKNKEPPYNFSQTTATTNVLRGVTSTNKSSVDSPDIIEVVPERDILTTSISSRRSLNIPSTSSNEGYRLHDLKRQSMSSFRKSGAGASPTVSSYTPQRTPTTILEVGDDDEGEEENEPTTQTITVEEVDEDDDIEEEDDNEESEEIAKVTSKKQKFTNGNLVGRSSSLATESGESRSSSVAQTAPPKSGMFNSGNRGLRTFSGNGLNFYSHLEGRKSLFSEKNMPGMLNNSTLSLTSLNRRQFNSSIYGSTSALSDSRLLNTSSPFYKGKTTYGGAAAYNKFNRTLNQSVRIAPTLIRPTSSLSSLSSSTHSLAQGNDQGNSTISSTAKRILELINDFSTPLNDAKKMASNIKTPAMLSNRSATGKRFSEADLATSRSVRLSAVRSPYTRPTVTLNPTNNDSKKLLPSLKELQVPSMSQLLQMKKMQSCTERSRQIANTSKSALNRECEYKLPVENEEATNDKNSHKHVSKIKNKVATSSRVSSKNAIVEVEEAPAPANLPNIAFPFMQSVPKIDIALKPSVPTPATKTDFKFEASKDAKPTNNFSFGMANKPKEVEKETPAMPKPSVNFNFGTNVAASTPIVANNEFKFSSPVNLNNAPTKGELAPINNFKFSLPVMVGGKYEGEKAVSKPDSVSTAVPQLKTGSVLDALKKPTEAVEPMKVTQTKPNTTIGGSTETPLFGAQFKKSSNEWECSACMVRNKDTADICVACTTPRAKKDTQMTSQSSSTLPLSNTLVKNTFGDAFKPKADTWECTACMVRNKSEANECVACNTKKAGATGGISSSGSATKLQTTDIGFKNLVSQQTASKWECDACLTRNDAERNKCVCCEQAKPGTQVVNENVPKFSFGTSSAAKFTFGFGNAGGKKEDELKAEAATKTENKTGLKFGIPAKSDATTTSLPTAGTGFVFGVKSVPKSTSNAGKDVPDVVKTNTTGFKFGIPATESTKAAGSEASAGVTTSPAGFSFGIKPDQAKPTSVTFNLPATTAEKKSVETSTTATSSTSSNSTASPSLFSLIGSSVFGAAPKVNEPKPVAAVEANKPTTGFVFGTPTQTPAPTAVSTPTSTATPTSTPAPTFAAKPITFGNVLTSDSNKTSPKIGFGTTPTTAATTAVVSSSSPMSGFAFGKPASTTAGFSSGFVFGKESTSNSPSLFGSPATNSTSAASKNAAPIFGTPAVTSTSTAVNSSTVNFGFGKPPTPSLFGSNTTPTTTSATTSVFGSKPASLFAGPMAQSSPSLTSTVSSTLNANPTSTSAVSSTPFVFGSGAASNAPQNKKPLFGSSESIAASTTSTATGWPTSTFTMGSSKPTEEVKANTTTAAPAFGSPASIFGQATPIFGSSQVSETKPTSIAPSPAFGAPPATTSLFGSNVSSTPAGAGAVQQPTGNVFGSANSTPIFGSMSFNATPAAAAATAAPGAPANSNNLAAAPTFGSLGSSSFSSGFGSLAAASSGSSDGASAPKKSEPAFNFGSSQNTGTGGFSFGSNNNNNNNNNKPATESVFKFSTTSAPSFNFTGSTEFGAPSSTPAVFNFSGVEATNSSGPFQFNAAAPAAAQNNIFAPLPTPGSQAASQQARRKMRTTSRRITPR